MTTIDWRSLDTVPRYGSEGLTQVLFLGFCPSSGRREIVSGWADNDGKPVQFYHYKLKISHWAPFPEVSK